MCLTLFVCLMATEHILKGLVFTISYQTQSYHPMILDSDLVKNFQGFILALNDTVHLCSSHLSTIRTEYTVTRHITYTDLFLLSTIPTTPHTSHWYCTIFLLYIAWSKPAKQVWYWALRVYWDQFRVYVCMYVCAKTPPKPLNRFAYKLYQQIERLTLIAIGYLDLKYLPNTMNILSQRERRFCTLAAPQRHWQR